MKRVLNHTIRYPILILMSILMLYPLIFTFTSSFMTPQEADQYPPVLIPSSFYMDNLINAWQLVPLDRFLLNSFIVALVVTLGQVVTSSMAAYAFAFIRFTGSALWFAVFLSTMMIPWEVTIIPNYITIRNWGWMDSYQGLIVPFLASAFGVFLLRQFFLQLPKDLLEAAKIDGCGHLRIFCLLVVPLSRPALGTLCVYVFINTWNMYLWPLLITNSENMRTVQIGISMLQWEEVMSWNLILAGVSIVLIPSLLFVLLGLKQLVEGIAAGAVKG